MPSPAAKLSRVQLQQICTIAGWSGHCLASAFLDCESSALAEPVSLSGTDQLINRIKEESPVVTAFFKLAYSVGFLFNPKGALPRDFFQRVKTISKRQQHGSGA